MSSIPPPTNPRNYNPNYTCDAKFHYNPQLLLNKSSVGFDPCFEQSLS